MNKISSFLIFITCSAVITSCGYGNFNECMREEIKQNSGKKNEFISNYCRTEFENILNYGEDYSINLIYAKYTQGDRYQELEIFNMSDLDIHTFKVHPHIVKKNSNCKKESKIDWSKEKNYLLDTTIKPSERITLRVNTTLEYGLAPNTHTRCFNPYAAGG